MLFSLQADAAFEADDLDDAFGKVAAHFKMLCEGNDSDLLLGGSIEIKPLKQEGKK